MGSGPSLLRADISACRAAGLPILACNDNYIFEPDVLYVADYPWVAHNLECLDHPNRWTPAQQIADRWPGWNLVQIDNTGAERGLSRDPSIIHHGHNAGYQMLNIAVLAGAKRIILLGYDMQATENMMRWRGEHPPGVEKSNAGKFAKWIEKFRTTVPDLEALGVEVINCTRTSALDCFERRALSDTLRACGDDST